MHHGLLLLTAFLCAHGSFLLETATVNTTNTSSPTFKLQLMVSVGGKDPPLFFKAYSKVVIDNTYGPDSQYELAQELSVLVRKPRTSVKFFLERKGFFYNSWEAYTPDNSCENSAWGPCYEELTKPTGDHYVLCCYGGRRKDGQHCLRTDYSRKYYVYRMTRVDQSYKVDVHVELGDEIVDIRLQPGATSQALKFVSADVTISYDPSFDSKMESVADGEHYVLEDRTKPDEERYFVAGRGTGYKAEDAFAIDWDRLNMTSALWKNMATCRQIQPNYLTKTHDGRMSKDQYAMLRRNTFFSIFNEELNHKNETNTANWFTGRIAEIDGKNTWLNASYINHSPHEAFQVWLEIENVPLKGSMREEA